MVNRECEKGMRPEKLARLFGLVVRFVCGSAAFGYWQHNWISGVFMFFFMVTVDVK